MSTVYYIMDPMCSWCWSFRPVVAQVQAALPRQVPLRYIMGGLAPDSDVPMPDAMRLKLRQTWHTIAEHTGAEFNFAFWDTCEPRRSTYPACRAVIAAGMQDEEQLPPMVYAIQQAYYLQARNPSDQATLVALAGEIGLDAAQFAADLVSDKVEDRFRADLYFAANLGVRGFPSLVVERDDTFYLVASGYSPAPPIIERIEKTLA
jgi:putative protein-disulfide isomerase